MYELIRQCRDNNSLRKSFNQLADRTFGLSFESWYQSGYWGDNYIPYSFAKDGEIIANVSVNRMTHWWEGRLRKFIQLGTVMTDERFRCQGLIRRLMEEIERDFQGEAEGVYLFANDTVLDFYPRFGFRKAIEYQYERTVKPSGTEWERKRAARFADRNRMAKSAVCPADMGNLANTSVCPVDMDNLPERSALEQAIRENQFSGPLAFFGNPGLYMFYFSDFMKENLYYLPELDVYAAAEFETMEPAPAALPNAKPVSPEIALTHLYLQAVFSRCPVSLDAVTAAFQNYAESKASGWRIGKITLGFVPEDSRGYVCREHHEEDTTLFVKGRIFDEFETRRVMFPVLGHA